MLTSAALRSEHIATGAIYGGSSRKRVGTRFLFTVEEVAEHQRRCDEIGMPALIRWLSR
jgi:hypothetical protein